MDTEQGFQAQVPKMTKKKRLRLAVELMQSDMVCTPIIDLFWGQNRRPQKLSHWGRAPTKRHERTSQRILGFDRYTHQSALGGGGLNMQDSSLWVVPHHSWGNRLMFFLPLSASVPL